MPLRNSSIILFDGECHFCSEVVRFTIRRDPKARFTFAPLQSDTGQQLLRAAGLPPFNLDTFVLIENGQAYTQSNAALRVVRKLHMLWPILYIFIAVPKPIRNAIYQWVARNRYRWFGRSSACMMPTPEIRHRFLE